MSNGGVSLSEDAESPMGVNVIPPANRTSTKHERDAGFIRGNLHFNWQARFGVYERPRNKTVRALLRPKVDNILPSLDWVMTPIIFIIVNNPLQHNFITYCDRATFRELD